MSGMKQHNPNAGDQGNIWTHTHTHTHTHKHTLLISFRAVLYSLASHPNSFPEDGHLDSMLNPRWWSEEVKAEELEAVQPASSS